MKINSAWLVLAGSAAAAAVAVQDVSASPQYRRVAASASPLLRLRGGGGSFPFAMARAGHTSLRGRRMEKAGGFDVAAALAPLAAILLKKALGLALGFALLGLDRYPALPPGHTQRVQRARTRTQATL